ncbi:MAG: pentapeptide repeat-containing protein, partial [Planctomycetales bacterium]|nr:pentapeptide repeat-containing protein [Planctomycetales bacterium]
IDFVTDKNLAEWQFVEQDLSFSHLGITDLTRANFTGATLSHTRLGGATLTDTNFRSAIISGADLSSTVRKGFTPAQLYETASYQQRDLRDVDFSFNDLGGWSLSGQDLKNASFRYSDLSNTEFLDADISHADFSRSNITADQLASTASYQRLDLHGLNLTGVTLNDFDFHLQNLTNAVFGYTPTDCCEESPDIRNVSFANAKLNNARLEEFRSADQQDGFRTVDFSGADLSSAHVGDFARDAKFSADTTYNQWTRFPPGFDPVARGLRFVRSADGDFDGDGQVLNDDLQALIDHRGSSDLKYDVDRNEIVDHSDVVAWITDIKHTQVGDVNLDGRFDELDLMVVLQIGMYEPDRYYLSQPNADWESGDWNGDGYFDAGDLVFAFARGGYRQPARAAHTVPEPTGVLLCLGGWMHVWSLRRSTTRHALTA